MSELHHHLVVCPICSIDDLRLCPDVPETTRDSMRRRAAEDPDAHRAYADKVIYERITTRGEGK